jgi:nucleotide-binding universal stress UspA family protein
MFQRLVVPLDGSLRAEQALPVAARLARSSGGSVLLVRVVSPHLDYSGGMAPAPVFTGEVIEQEMAEATDYLNTVAASPMLAGIESQTEVSYGPPTQGILAAAEAYGSDLVVLCSHGRTGFLRWTLGSIAHKLIHKSAVPVLVLRQDEAASHLSHLGTRPLCTLVPLDGSPLAEEALIPAAHLTAALAAPAQGALHLVQIVKFVPVEAGEGYISELNEEALQRARTYLASVADRVHATTKDLHLVLPYAAEFEADAASALLSLAEQEGADAYDLIAISTHGRGGLERWVMGSVTEHLLNTTKLPMLIVRPQKQG